MQDNQHYIYQHINKITSEVFYIGIGCGNNYARANSVFNRNKFWNNYVNKHAYEVIIIEDLVSKDYACSQEIELIKKQGRRCDGTGPLVNLSTGGENSLFGIPRSEEHKRKISLANTGRIASLETRKKQSDVRMGKFYMSDEAKEKGRLAHVGKKLTPEHIEKIRAANIGKKLGPRSQSAKEKTKATMALKFTGGSPGCKSIYCYNNNKSYHSTRQAARELKISDKHIPSVCKGARSNTNGYFFCYAESINSEFVMPIRDGRGRVLSADSLYRMGSSTKGKIGVRKGAKHTEETKIKMRGRKFSDEHKKNLSLSHLSRKEAA